MAKLRIPNFQVIGAIRASELAAWLDDHADRWWRADGEQKLMQTMNFPCPGDELARAFRAEGERRLEILSDKPTPTQVRETDAQGLAAFADRENRHRAMNFLFRWEGGRGLWLLSEDVPASESSSEDE